jgi:methionyl-tRNA formyltransferase
MNPLNLVFFGSPDFALPSLQILIDQNRKPCLVVTQGDKVRGRGHTLSPTPVKTLALAHHIPVITPENVNDPEVLAQLKATQADLFLTVAYGQIFRKDFLALPRYGTLNVHASLLPQYRGAAPYQWAILQGESKTGVTIIEVVPKLDAGPMLQQEALSIGAEENAGELYERLSHLGARLLLETVYNYEKNQAIGIPQREEEATKFGKLSKEEGQIDWKKPALFLTRFVRAMTPWPRAYTFYQGSSPPKEVLIHKTALTHGEGQPGEILQFNSQGIHIACGEQALSLLELQVSGKRVMSFKDFVNGTPWKKGQFLGNILV